MPALAVVTDIAPRRPAALPTIATVAAVALFVTAGLWQRDRMEQKLALRAQLDAAQARAPEPLPDVRDWAPLRFVPVSATGTFDAARQILIDNRTHDGVAGYHVVAPLALADGRVVLVDRGWVAGGATRADLPRVPPPAGVVTVRGRINTAPSSFVELNRDTVAGAVWQNLDVGRYAQATGMAVLPIVVEQTAPAADADALVRDWPAPDLGADKHRIYMVQWFTFALLAAGLWLYFTFLRRR
ncbi:MAG: SURF1 family protein [Burkholderiales bacterium]